MILISAFKKQSYTNLWIQVQSTNQVSGKPSLNSEEVGKQKAGNGIKGGRHVPASACNRTQQVQACGSGFRVNKRRDYWENWCWLAGAKKLVVIWRHQHHWGKIFWEIFPERTEKLCSWSTHGCTSCWQLDLVNCKSHLLGTGFEGMKGSWRAAEAWHWEDRIDH